MLGPWVAVADPAAWAGGLLRDPTAGSGPYGVARCRSEGDRAHHALQTIHHLSGPVPYLLSLGVGVSALLCWQTCELVVVKMAPRKGETAEEKINRMYQNASQAISRAQYKEVMTALKSHPQHIPAVHRQLATSGALPGGSKSPSKGPSAEDVDRLALCDSLGSTKGAACNPSTADTTEADDTPADSTGGTDSKATFCFDRNTSRVEHLSPTHLQVALTSLEPASLSKANLSKIKKRGCRDFNKNTLLRYWEYMTGQGPAMPLAKDGNKTWDAFLASARDSNDARGRRLSDTVLPIDWYERGLYNFSLVREGELELTKKTRRGIMKTSFPIPKSALEFRIEQNWSEAGAVLTQVNGPMVQPLAVLFLQPSAEQDADVGSASSSNAPGRRVTYKRSAPGAEQQASSKKRATTGQTTITIDTSSLEKLVKKTDLQLKFNPKPKAKGAR